MHQSFIDTGFSLGEILAIYSIISAVLHIGNLQFDDSCLTDKEPCALTANSAEGMKLISQLLEVKEKNLRKVLVFKTREVSK